MADIHRYSYYGRWKHVSVYLHFSVHRVLDVLTDAPQSINNTSTIVSVINLHGHILSIHQQCENGKRLEQRNTD